MNAEKVLFNNQVKIVKQETKTVMRISWIMVAVLGLSWTTYLHMSNEAKTKALNNELTLIQTEIKDQETQLANMNAKSYRESAIEAKFEKQSLKPINDVHYKLLTAVYTDPKTDDLTRKIIKDMMADNVVTVEEFSKHSALFNSTIEKINQEKIKADLIENLKK